MSKRYKLCADIFKEVLARSRQHYTIESLSEESGIAIGTLNGCKQGARYLNDDNALVIAQTLGLSDAEGAEFRRATKAAREAAEPERERSLREILADPNASLRVEGLRYLPFSDENQFVDLFLRRFFQLSGIAMKPPVIGNTVLGDRTARLLDGESHIAVNLFCSLPRLKKLDFLLFPIRLSISAVIPARFRHRIGDIQDRLLGKKSKTSQMVRLVVVHGEVGHEHAKTVAGYEDNEMEVLPKWDPEKFVQSLLDLDNKCEDPGGTIPVLLCDEIICLLVLRHLEEKGFGDRFVLVFPLTTKLNIRRFDNRRETPEYRLGLAVNRERRDLKEYLRESLQFYLLTDPEYLARLYAALFGDLVKYVLESIKGQYVGSPDQPNVLAPELMEHYRLARDFARYALRLDREGIDSYRDQFLPWRNILRRAYQIVCVEQAGKRLQIRRLLEHILRERLGKDFNKGEITREWHLIERPLQEEFDVRLNLSSHTPRSLEGLVSVVQTALLASATSEAQFEVPVIEAEAEHRRQVLELFADFMAETKERGSHADPIPSGEELATLIPDDPNGDRSVIVLLAVLHGQFIGCVQVGPSEEGSVRLTRLFVKRRWRGEPDAGVSASLVWKAIECAAERLKGSSVFIKEAHTPQKLSKFFQDKGFLRVENRTDMLHYPLDETTA